jgi:single-stranded DNA-binding protein
MAIASFNKVIIGGRLGRDPEFHTFEGGDRVARLKRQALAPWHKRATANAKRLRRGKS